VKIFLDECVDWRLSREMTGHEVKSARQMGWLAIKNGELLSLAGRAFDVFVTADRNLSFQQNTENLPIPIIVLCAATNRLADLKPLIPELMIAIANARGRTVTLVGDRANPPRR
jgi:Domain of unknown function (DUF5615)